MPRERSLLPARLLPAGLLLEEEPVAGHSSPREWFASGGLGYEAWRLFTGSSLLPTKFEKLCG